MSSAGTGMTHSCCPCLTAPGPDGAEMDLALEMNRASPGPKELISAPLQEDLQRNQSGVIKLWCFSNGDGSVY